MPQNLKSASKKAIHKGNVDKLDTLGRSKDVFDIEGALNVIELVCGQFIERVLENIKSKPDFVVTGAITDITLDPTDTGVNIMAHPHLIYQSRGVSGTERKYDTPHEFTNKMPPGNVFEDWIRRKKLNLRDNEKYSRKKTPFKLLTEEDKIKSVSWAISRSIFKKGIPPKDVYEKEIPKLLQDLQKEISDFMVQNIVQVVDIHPRGGGENRIIIK